MLQAFRILFLPQDWLETVYGISGVKNVCGMELRYEKFTKLQMIFQRILLQR